MSRTFGEVHVSLCDHLNSGFGYQLRIVDDRGALLLLTTCDPVSGRELLTVDDALRVATAYVDTTRRDDARQAQRETEAAKAAEASRAVDIATGKKAFPRVVK